MSFIKKLMCRHPGLYEYGRYKLPYNTLWGEKEVTRIVKVCPDCKVYKMTDISY